MTFMAIGYAFWLLAIPLGYYTAWQFRRRAIRDSEPDEANLEEINKLARGLRLKYLVPAATGFLFQLASGSSSPLFFMQGEIKDPFKLGFWIVIIVSWVVTSRWIWFQGGIALISKYHRAFNLPKNETLLKLIFALSILGGIIGMAIAFSGLIPEFPISPEP